MPKLRMIFSIVFFCCIAVTGVAGERTIPVDIFLMIDKSKSMDEAGKFNSLHTWVRDTLVTEMIIPEDWITVWEFYEEPHELLSFTVKTEADRNKLIGVIDSIRPDGAFTDIGKALDAIQVSLNKRGRNNRYKILLLVTDLEQDAPWTSKYRGKQASFESPYLAEARIIRHDNWYEITLDMDIQDKVVKTTKELYTGIKDNAGVPRIDANQDRPLIQEKN
ncbi:MAG: VWA domain-containing protein [Treponema sp.]